MGYFANSAIAIILTALAAAAADRLYVFFPAPARPQAVQKSLSENFPGFEISVFGRYIDFKNKLDADKPKAILVHPLLLKQCGDYEICLNGTRSGKTQQKFELVSLDSAVPLASISSRTVGMLDFLGKEGMDELAARIFPAAPKIKRVTKIEDLLPLLSFGMADAVLVSEQQAAFLKENSRLNLVFTEIPHIQAGIAVLALHKNLKLTLKKPGEGNKTIGVDAWK